MAGMIRAETEWALDSMAGQDVTGALNEAVRHLGVLLERKGTGADYTGWINLPVETPENLLARLEESAAVLREQSDTVVVCGIGGSYLGARAGLEFLEPWLSQNRQGTGPAILFAGNSLSSWQLHTLLKALEEKRFSVIVVSKSGTTLETAVAFHILRAELVRRFGVQEASRRIVAVTDAEQGTLRDLSGKEGFTAFDLPRDIGGRYSVLTPVGLLPFAVAGINIRSMLQGAAEQREASLQLSPTANDALRYAATRRLLDGDGKKVELLTNFEPCLHYVGEWWKQLFGESEGKDGKGVFPAAADFTTDLHSLGQFVQDGTRVLFETSIDVPSPGKLPFVCEADSPDGLSYLNGRDISTMNQQARLGTLLAHHDDGIPVVQLSIPDVSPASFGGVVYFFETACAVSGYMLGINPFDQPGVEAYKRNMFALLEKPGTEAEAAGIRSRLHLGA